MEQHPGLLHLVVELTGRHSGDLDFGAQESAKNIRVVALCNGFHVLPLHQQFEGNHALSETRIHLPIGRADCAPNRDQTAVGVGANHLVEGRVNRFGQRSMAQKLHIVARHIRVEARPHLASYQDPVAGN
jgi:hypothetical protein